MTSYYIQAIRLAQNAILKLNPNCIQFQQLNVKRRLFVCFYHVLLLVTNFWPWTHCMAPTALSSTSKSELNGTHSSTKTSWQNEWNSFNDDRWQCHLTSHIHSQHCAKPILCTTHTHTERETAMQCTVHRQTDRQTDRQTAVYCISV